MVVMRILFILFFAWSWSVRRVTFDCSLCGEEWWWLLCTITEDSKVQLAYSCGIIQVLYPGKITAAIKTQLSGKCVVLYGFLRLNTIQQEIFIRKFALCIDRRL